MVFMGNRMVGDIFQKSECPNLQNTKCIEREAYILDRTDHPLYHLFHRLPSVSIASSRCIASFTKRSLEAT